MAELQTVDFCFVRLQPADECLMSHTLVSFQCRRIVVSHGVAPIMVSVPVLAQRMRIVREGGIRFTHKI
eukprot:scaffold4649_cov72-Cyclotella_meneghiniana.AAC.11